MSRLGGIALLTTWMAGCPSSHGPEDASIADGSIEDAGAACTIDGVSIATADGECSCGEHEFVLAVDAHLRVCSGTEEGEQLVCAVHTCELGHVCSDYVGTPNCMGAKACLVLHDLRSETAEPWRCVYADMTQAVTGDVPGVVCDDAIRRRGLCGVNCPCPDESRCYGPSETHPIGACAPLTAEGGTQGCLGLDDGFDDCEAGEACLRPAAVHDWYSETRFSLGDDVGRPHGACVPIEACEALVAEYPGVWFCA